MIIIIIIVIIIVIIIIIIVIIIVIIQHFNQLLYLQELSMKLKFRVLSVHCFPGQSMGT